MRKLVFCGIVSIVIASCGNTSTDKNQSVEQIYLKRCSACHGAEGNAGITGAPDLSVSTIDDNLARTIITHGKGTMPAFKTVLTPDEIDSLIAYIKTLRK